MTSERGEPRKEIDPTFVPEAPNPDANEVDALESTPLDDLGVELSPDLLGFIQELESALANPATDPQELKRLFDEYSARFERFADLPENEVARGKIQIAAMLHKADIFKNTGNIPRCLEEWDLAVMDIQNLGLGPIDEKIDKEIDIYLDQLLSVANGPIPEVFIIELKGRVNDPNRSILWKIWDKEQVLGPVVDVAYDMLIMDREDPERTLRGLGIYEYYWESQ